MSKRKKWAKGIGRGGFGEVGALVLFRAPVAVPPLPRPASSSPDNGTSPGGACAVCPGPSAGGGAGDPESGCRATWREQVGVGSAQSSMQGREAGGPQLQRGCLRSRMFPPTKAPELSRGGRGPEAAPTVGSVLPLVHHGRGGRGGESEPARPQPGRARGSAGCSAPPRTRARPSHLVILSRPHQWESRAGGGGTQGRGRAREGVEPQPLFPIWALERPSRFV